MGIETNLLTLPRHTKKNIPRQKYHGREKRDVREFLLPKRLTTLRRREMP